MPKVEAQIFKKKGTRKILRLQLEEGDDIMASIKQAMAEHKLEEARVEDASGFLKSGQVNYMEGNRYKSKDLKNQELFRASGNYKLNYGELYGTLHVSWGKPLQTATFVKGTAEKGMELKLSFIELTDK